MSKIDLSKVGEVIVMDEGGFILDRFDFTSVIIKTEKGEKTQLIFKKKFVKDTGKIQIPLCKNCGDTGRTEPRTLGNPDGEICSCNYPGEID